MNTIIDACSRCLTTQASGTQTIFVGFSGGLDSTVLLHALHTLVPGRIAALHVNHGIAADSSDWEAHCARLCEDWGIPLRCTRLALNVSSNVEGVARARRYAFFTDVLATGGFLLLGHHLDDQRETQLLHLLQGRGLYGMPQQRALAGGRLLRPLLAIARSEIRRYAVERELPWCEDVSNHDVALDRNFLRHQLLPRIKARFPGFPQRLASLSDTTDVLQKMLAAELGVHEVRLPLVKLLPRPLPERVVILRLWLQGRGIRSGVSDASLRAFAQQLDAPASRQPELKLAAGSVRRFAAELYYVGMWQKPASSYAFELPGELVLPHGTLCVELTAGCVRDGFIAHGEVAVRFREGGEVLLRGGHHRALKQMLQEAAIAPWHRADYPLLFDKTGLLAVPGIAWRDDVAVAADATSAEHKNAARAVQSDPVEGGPARRFVASWRPQ